ncbi:hypothetical protein ABB37_01851 [Leptomonas pyrrhocoris]|uniref:Leucine-rich repeat protein (LRRP) n=1 Tax=Leptomonas pyrrhocoris TaxID=157538 RepID=A0A0M9G6N9_LEPPY|nr:hypothetical protein ABB37_09964 [Leptomonas pyrrhocoris]XP_015661986.1 hypothetical protein ABB37_01851 [Leptomonas pyrrhocoris]XP_015661987.1 hypothetical protein ABB37_01851 [Leptomonas pyrrhocoris]KPA73245.1 hypothetical protein ABB37_09964 [Leptomonas pyrrhocoris]KPA83547.1 hypothetical protein ABB37_01851 [Leptomonas pyrrhocoris]KPA83548.1 hypothetical protein ABB37_01851 [Leptomonas pyrrhocoris]|eukprot:XP_015651684.1 hypothetical protein ABB37_09964 [Leptomonas pyrrhocoris]
MFSSTLSFDALTAITSFYDPTSTPLALTAASPATRESAEMTAFAEFPHRSAELLPGRVMFGLDPRDGERVAAIGDMQQFERMVWWLTRPSSAAGRRPFPLRSVHFCLDSSVESPVDVVARVPLCAATVTSLNLNTRCDMCNQISSLRAISQLVGLRELLMKHTTVSQSSRPLPVNMTDDLHAVFRNLRKLVVGDYYVVQQLPLKDLHHLEEVDLSGTGVNVAVMEAIAGCCRVRSLKLRGCLGIDDFAPLGALTQLSCLDLSHTHLRDHELRHLCKCCQRLSSFALNHCDALGNFAPLEELNQLSCLHVGHTAFRNSDLERVCVLPELAELHIESCRLLDVFGPLAFLRDLCDLDARDTWVDDAGVVAIAQCTKLRRVTLSGCASISKFSPLSQLTHLEHLCLSGCLIADACLNALCTPMMPLRTFLLNGCRVLRDFTPLRRLQLVEEIGVCDTAFNDTSLQAVAQCGQLAKLHLHICIAVTSLSPLTSCAHLRYLGIGGTRFSSGCCEAECAALRERGVQLNHQLFLVSSF